MGPGPGGFPPMPGAGGPGYPPGGPGPGPGGGQGLGAPQSPPPSFIPQQSPSLYAVDPGSIRGCLYRNVYIWQDNGDQYWMFLTHVGRNSISGYRWYGYGSQGFWLYFGLDLRRINQFTCF
ncbi:collagen-like protein [Paenibacillus sp. LMG 31456]|uniref:Collagen-like protein n=2 Tax=Paenibacillus foliorum TaxID=2654974 RepID=A0A972GZ05_9BACL|nr:collagen-like protein [Paenibacillus foliorum]